MAGGALALSLPLAPQRTAVPLQVNEVSPLDIRAPYSVSYTSEILTEQARQAAEAGVPDQFDPPEARTARQQVDRLRSTLTFIDSVRGDPFASPEDRRADLAGLADLRLTADQAQVLLELAEARWQALKLEAITVLEQVMRSEIREGQSDAARRSVSARPAFHTERHHLRGGTGLCRRLGHIQIARIFKGKLPRVFFSTAVILGVLISKGGNNQWFGHLNDLSSRYNP